MAIITALACGIMVWSVAKYSKGEHSNVQLGGMIIIGILECLAWYFIFR